MSTVISPFQRKTAPVVERDMSSPSPTRKVPPLSMSKPTTCMARKALTRWNQQSSHNYQSSAGSECSFQFEERQTAHDLQMLKLSKRYSKLYASNVYKLNSACLRIQHWYMKQSLRRNEGKIEL